MSEKTLPHPKEKGGALPPYPYRGRALYDQAVWYIKGAVEWIPDGRRKGKDRPKLTFISGHIDHQIGERLIRVRLDNGETHWLNMMNFEEGRRLQDRPDEASP